MIDFMFVIGNTYVLSKKNHDKRAWKQSFVFAVI